MALKDKAAPAAFGVPQVSAGVPLDPSAAKYMKHSAAARPLQPEGHAMPVGGVPSPPIPPLNQGPTDVGLSMADYAARRVPLSPEQQQALGVGGGAATFVQPAAAHPRLQPPWAADPAAASPPLVAPTAPPSPAVSLARGLLPGDVLPERARQDPAYQHGLGSDMAINQPALAMRYGVVRNSRHIPPQQLSSGRPGLSDETKEGLAAVMRNMESDRVSHQPPSEDRAVEQAAKLAGAPAPTLVEETEKAKKSALEALDDFDYMKLRAVLSDMLGNEEQRKIVEERLTPLSLDALLMQGFVEQEVPIVVDPVTREKKFFPTFRSTTGQTDSALKLLLMEEVRALDLRGAYFDEKFAMMGACACTLAINGRPLPEYLDAKGNFNKDMFLVKFERFVRLPVHTISSLGVHAFWFDMRVRQLHVSERIKNG